MFFELVIVFVFDQLLIKAGCNNTKDWEILADILMVFYFLFKSTIIQT